MARPNVLFLGMHRKIYLVIEKCNRHHCHKVVQHLIFYQINYFKEEFIRALQKNSIS